MTTKVIVSNYGPDIVTIKAVDNNGTQMGQLTVVKPNEFKEHYVHLNQKLILEEVK